MPPPVDDELQLAAATCQDALAAPEFAALGDILPDAPRCAEGWFELLSKCNQDRKSTAALIAMRSAIPADLIAGGGAIERYAVLRALSVAALHIASALAPITVKRLYATLCIEIAAREHQWDSHFDMSDYERFLDIAEIATLRKFPAGAANFAYEQLAFVRTTLQVHPLSLPGYLYQRTIPMPFYRRALGPHVNYARKGRLILQQKDYERSLWLMAKTIEMNPKVSGVIGRSWFCSQIVGEVFPHLAWMRAVFADGGAYLIDTFPADPGGYGFAYNNRRRQILYDQGKFCPRETALFWSRDDFLAWASRHSELAPEGEEPVRAPERRAFISARSPRPAKHAKHNSPVTLWNGKAALERLGWLKYLGFVLVLPAVLLSLAVFCFAGPWLALLTFPVIAYLVFSFQYFFSQ